MILKKLFAQKGKVLKIDGIFVIAKISKLKIGELCYIIKDDKSKISAEVISLEKNIAKLILLDNPEGCKVGDKIVQSQKPIGLPVGDFLLGKIIDPYGNVICGEELNLKKAEYVSTVPKPTPYVNYKVNKIFPTGIKSIDGWNTIGYGQKMFMLHKLGTGAQTLTSIILKNSPADINVISFVGKTNRELQSWIDDVFDEQILKNSIIIAANSSDTLYNKMKCMESAVALCQYFREHGKNVLFISDSILKAAEAHSEIAIAKGDKYTQYNYPNSTISWVSNIIESCYSSDKGTITSLFSLCCENLDDYIITILRQLTDGHIFLARGIAEANIYPAIDIMGSISRCMRDLVDEKHYAVAANLRNIFGEFRNNGGLEEGYQHQYGQDENLDFIYTKGKEICDFLKQGTKENWSYEETKEKLISLLPTLRRIK